MNPISITFCLLASSSSFLFTITTVWHLSEFLSSLNQPHHITIYSKLNESKDVNLWDDVLRHLLCDIGLVMAFIVCHSILSRPHAKSFLAKCGITVLYRSLYLAISNVFLQLLMTRWTYVTDYPLWAFDTNNNARTWWFFTVVHWAAWIGLYGGCILMDFAELMGIKQVYYYSHGSGDPMLLKKPSLQRLYTHMRHPSFLAFFVILWCYPVMTLDRYVIAFMLTVYMSYQFNVDRDDHEYMCCQFRRKHSSMSYVAQLTSCQG